VSEARVTLRFYEELNFFLRDEQQKCELPAEIAPGQTVKDLIESFGVPHVEVDLILVDGEPVDFAYQPQSGQRISVYPVFERFDISPLARLRPEPLREPRFIADVHLGTLARRLRILGFYTEYPPHGEDEYLAARAAGQGLILLSRDRQLLMRKIVSRGMYVRATQPREQVREIVYRLDLYDRLAPFSRCVACNGLLRDLPVGSAEWEEHKGSIPPGVRKWCSTYRICTACGKLFWRGSHVKRLEELLEVLAADRERVRGEG
jgi:hypothetical protein